MKKNNKTDWPIRRKLIHWEESGGVGGYSNQQAGPALVRLPCVSETTGWGSVTHAALRLTAETHLTPFLTSAGAPPPSPPAAASVTAERGCDLGSEMLVQELLPNNGLVCLEPLAIHQHFYAVMLSRMMRRMMNLLLPCDPLWAGPTCIMTN